MKSWIGLVSKNYEIECALVELEKEIIELKKKKATQSLDENESPETLTHTAAVW